MNGNRTYIGFINLYKQKKVISVVVCLILLVIGLTIMIISGQLIAMRNYIVPVKEIGKVRIVALSDLHGNMYGKDQIRIVNKVQKAAPDLIVYLGDMVDQTNVEESVASLLILTEQLVQIAPIYYVDGNHEQDIRENDIGSYKKLKSELENIGAVQLENETVQLEVKNDTVVNLSGISTHYNWGDEENNITAELRQREGITILMCHYPESVLWYKPFEGCGLDLALCGHTHGGLVRVPFIGGLYAPEAGWWPMYDLGDYPIYSDTTWYNYGGDKGAEYWGTMIISGGLAGEHGVPRVNNPMEISVMDIG